MIFGATDSHFIELHYFVKYIFIGMNGSYEMHIGTTKKQSQIDNVVP